eukprot:13838924-Alexandrium_andersonii.AAC.1
MVDIIVSLYLESKASAKQLCELCFWAAKAGAAGALVQDYALKPGQSSGNYQRHVDLVMGWNRDLRDYYTVTCPGRPRSEAFGRHSMQVPFLPPHELLDAELEEDPSLLDRLEDCLETLPPVYHDNPVVRSAAPDEKVIPLQLYLDGVPYSNGDSVVALWQ